MQSNLEFTLPSPVNDLFVLLNADYTVYIMDGPTANASPKRDEDRGHWTLVYDQSMIIELPSRQAKYVANFRYSLKPEI